MSVRGALLRLRHLTTAPTTPAADTSLVYFNSSGVLTAKNPSGTERSLEDGAILSAGGGNTTTQWLRVATLNGGSASLGNYCEFIVAGQGQYINANGYRTISLVNFSQKGSNLAQVQIHNFGHAPVPWVWYTKQISEFVFELWAKRAGYDAITYVTPLTPPGAVITLDQKTNTDPGASLVAVPTSGILDVTNALSDTDWVYVGSGGSAPAFAGAWVNYSAGYVPARYRRKNGTVYVEGLVKSGGGTIFTLPVGFRPAYNLITAGIEGTNTVCRTDVNSNGTVVAAAGASTAFWVIDAVFPAEQ